MGFREEKLERRRNGQVFIPTQARAGRNMAFLLAPFTMVPRTDFTFHRMDLHHKCKGGHGNDHPVFSWMKHLPKYRKSMQGGSRNLLGEVLQVKHRIFSDFGDIRKETAVKFQTLICNCCISIS